MCFFISKRYDKVYHINNSTTDEKVCDIHLITTHRLSGPSTINVKVNNSAATMRGKTIKGCCNQEINTIKNNMPITIQYPSIPQLFEQHSVQFVSDMAPIWDKPLSRLHLHINNKNVIDSSRVVTEFTDSSYTTPRICIWWILFIFMSLIFTFIYTLIFSLFIGTYTWIAIEAHVVFGCLTWITIWSGISKSLCGCSDPGPSEIDLSFDSKTGEVEICKRMETIIAQTSDNDSDQNITKEIELRVLDENSNAKSGKLSNENDIMTDTQWNRPDDQNEHIVPSGWSKVHTAGGKSYYQNDVTIITKWDRPIVLNEAVEIVQIEVKNKNDMNKNKMEENLKSEWVELYQNNIKKTQSL